MTTVLQVRSKGFVSTPSVERLTRRALRYLQAGFSLHLRGPAGTGKTTLALHLADLLSRPIMLIFGDDEFTTSDLIGNQTGYTRKKVVDNFIHSVVKLEDEMRQTWVDSRLTMACREGFTLVYDEFNRSRPEVNNVLLSALEEKLLVLPPNAHRNEYIRVNPHFRGIFTSNPEEYCGVHATQDALLDRLVTINMPEPDELTQQEVLVQKTGIARDGALFIVRLVQLFRTRTHTDKSSGLRSCLMISKVCHDYSIPVTPDDEDFRDICGDVLLSRAGVSFAEAKQLLWQLFKELQLPEAQMGEVRIALTNGLGNGGGNGVGNGAIAPGDHGDLIATLNDDGVSDDGVVNSTAEADGSDSDTTDWDAKILAATQVNGSSTNGMATHEGEVNGEAELATPTTDSPAAATKAATATLKTVPYEDEVLAFLQTQPGANVSQVESALKINRVRAVNALRSLTEKDLVTVQRDHKSGSTEAQRTVYHARTAEQSEQSE